MAVGARAAASAMLAYVCSRVEGVALDSGHLSVPRRGLHGSRPRTAPQAFCPPRGPASPLASAATLRQGNPAYSSSIPRAGTPRCGPPTRHALRESRACRPHTSPCWPLTHRGGPPAIGSKRPSGLRAATPSSSKVRTCAARPRAARGAPATGDGHVTAPPRAPRPSASVFRP